MRVEPITLDTYKMYLRTVPLVQYNTTELQFILQERGTKIDINVYEIFMNAKRSDGYVITQDFDIKRENGILKIKLSSKILKLAGDVSFEIVLKKEKEVISTYPFTGYIEKTLTDIEDVLEGLENDDSNKIVWEHID